MSEDDREQFISPLEIHGAAINAGFRLEWLRGLVDRHLASLSTMTPGSPGGQLVPPVWKSRPAFEVHICSGIREILADPECRMTLRHIVAQGVAANVVVFLAEPVEVCSAELAGASGRLAAELVAGHALRHMSSRSVVRS